MPSATFGRVRRPTSILVLAAILVASCTDDGDGDESVASTIAAQPDAPTTTSEMRPVPTVPPPTIEGQEPGDVLDDGLVEVAPTVAPTPAVSTGSTPDVAPPTTEFVGDPQPSPDTTAPPPPETVAPPPPACERLAAAGVPDELAGWVQAVDASTPMSGVDGCRYETGDVVTEVWFVPLSDVREDWFRREGIEPVTVAGGDAVGLDGFRSAAGSTGPGYTVATVGGAQGVIVSVGDTADAELAADFVAALAAQAA